MKLIIDNLSKEFKGNFAVHNFQAELTEGVYGLLGPNGSGKTTLLRLLVGVLKPSRGRVLVDGQDIEVMGDKYRAMLGYLPQDFGVYRNFSAKRFLAYIAALKDIEKELVEQRVEETLKLVNLWEERDKKLGKFSGGMKRRLGIAQALLNDSSILILDEPTAGLDPKERARLRNIISELSRDRIVLFSTHIVADIEYIAKEVMLIKQGGLVRKDDPQIIIQEIEGKVWTATVPEHSLAELQRQFCVGNIMQRPDGVEVRVIADEKPVFNARSAAPRLEDIYLYYFESGTEEQWIS